MSVAYSYLLLGVLAIFLFCYFVGTWVWIKVAEKNKKIVSQEEQKTTNASKQNRRDFLYLSSITVGGVGVASFMWPFIKSMNPAEDTLALGTTEVDISNITEGQSVTVKWRGTPVFIRRRTQQEIKEANNIDISSLRDPIEDSERVKKPEWLVLVGICTHLGCVPLGQKITHTKGIMPRSVIANSK